jgi:hypothetical protein
MKDLEFKCASVTGAKRGDLMIVKKNENPINILFKNIRQSEFGERCINMCLSPTDSLKLATTIINEFCDTKKASKKVLKARIAYQQDIIQNLTKLVEDKKVRIELLERYLKESNPCVDDLTDLKL